MASKYWDWSGGQISLPWGTCSVYPMYLFAPNTHTVPGTQRMASKYLLNQCDRSGVIIKGQAGCPYGNCYKNQGKKPNSYFFFSYGNTSGCWAVTRARKVPTGDIRTLWQDLWSVNFSFQWLMPLCNLMGQEEHEPRLLTQRGAFSCRVLGELIQFVETCYLHIYLREFLLLWV